MCLAMLFGPAHSLVFQPTGILRFFLFLIKKPGSRQHPVPGLPDIQRIPCAKNDPSGIPLKRKSLVLYLGGFFRLPSEKKRASYSHSGRVQGSVWINYRAEFKLITRALEAHGRGANLPYFGKQGNILPYSPCEQKRKPIQGFPGVSDISEREKGPVEG